MLDRGCRRVACLVRLDEIFDCRLRVVEQRLALVDCRGERALGVEFTNFVLLD